MQSLLLLLPIWAGIALFLDGSAEPKCPKSCFCKHNIFSPKRLTIRDCLTEPTGELYAFLRANEDIWGLYIVNASLSRIGDISFLHNLTELSLLQNNLMSLPCELSKLPKLAKLRLNNNKINTIECELSQFRQLITLYLDNNNLKTVPCKLPNLPNLSGLWLSNNSINAVTCELRQLKQLKHLHLDHNKLKSVPCELSKLSKLTRLELQHNEIKRVDCDLSSLTQLHVINMNYNNLTSVPCELSMLSNLETLQLSNNTIETVNCDLSNLTKLGILHLDYNYLTSVPCELSKLRSLVDLQLSFNHIERVDCDLSPLKLYNLNLNYNRLTSVPCELSKLFHLEVLSLIGNEIRTVDCELPELYKLYKLYLDYNKLKSVPCELSKLPRLTELWLLYNDIETVDCEVSELTELTYLFLDNNKLRTVPCKLSQLPNLAWLSLSYNDIETVDCHFSQLRQLNSVDLSHNNLKSVPCELLRSHSLESLYLSNNYIESIECNFSLAQSDYLLDLSYNNLTTLPLLTGISEVIVSNNAVMEFTNNAGLNVSCEDLPGFSLMNNNITHLSRLFTGWGLPINEINEFGRCIAHIINIRQFSGNPLVCDCEEYLFYSFLRRTVKKNWVNPCQRPINLQGQNPNSVPLDQFVCKVKEDCPVGCSCVSVPGAQALRVSCTAYTGVVMPRNLPALEKGTFYEFDMSGRQLDLGPFRPYFSNTTKAVFSNSSISNLPMSTLRAFAENIKMLYLDNNKLQWLPQKITMIRFRSLVELRLDNNPWHCDCHALSLRDFVIMKNSIIRNVDSIKCHSPPEVLNIKVTDLSRSYFCQKENGKDTFSITVIATTCTLLLVVSASICIQKCRKMKEGVPTNVQQYNRGGLMAEIDEVGRKFDIFVSYATYDEEYAGEWLIPELERRGFKVCFHRVHFLGGVPIHVNMCECINNSKRVLVFFSKNFLDSGYCMYEFDLALSLDIDAGTRKLVTIKEATLNTNTLEPGYAAYFQTHTYIAQGAANFWENLLWTMPQNKLGEVAEPEVDEHAV